MAGVCLIRAFLEGAWESTGQIGFGLEPLQSQLMVFIHLPAFFLSLFLLIILLVHGLTGQPIERVTRAVAAGSPVIILPVIIDRLLGGGYQLYYLSELRQIPEFLFFTFVPGHRLPGASSGIRIEVALGCLAGAWYCWQKTHSVWRSASAFLLIFLCCILVGSLPLLFSEACRHVSGGSMGLAQVFGPGGLIPTDTGKYAILFLLLSLVLSFLWLARGSRRLFSSVMASARPLRTIHYTGMVLIGFWIGWLMVGPAYPQAFANPFDYLYAVAAVAAIIGVFQSAVLVNDLFDREIDTFTGKPNPLSQGQLESGELVKLAVIYLVLSLAFATALGQTALLIVLFAHALSLAYSAPPLRLKKFYPISVLTIALASLAAAWLGFSAFGGVRTLSIFPARLSWFIIVCFGLSFATKDLNDVEGDRQAGIITLSTIFGVKWGKMSTALLVIIAYLIGPLILNEKWLLVAAVPAGLATAWLTLRPKVREGWVFVIYFVYGFIVAASLALNPVILHSEQGRARGQGLSGLDHFWGRDYVRAAPRLQYYLGTEGDHTLFWPLARALYGAGIIEKAGQAADSLIERHPTFERAYHLAARIKKKQGSGGGAMAVYRKALDLGLSVRDFHRHIGDVAYELDSLETASEHYRLAMASGGERAGLLSRIAKVRLAQGDTLKAGELAEQARRAGLRRAGDMIMVGQLFVEIGKYEMALELAEQASRKGGLWAEAANLRGSAFEGLGLWAEACRAHAEAVRADPDFWPSWLALSRSYLAVGKPLEAGQAMARALEVQGTYKGESGAARSELLELGLE